MMALFLAVLITFSGCTPRTTPVFSDPPDTQSTPYPDDTDSSSDSSGSTSVSTESSSVIPNSVSEPPDSSSTDDPDISDPPISTSTDDPGSSGSSTTNHQSSTPGSSSTNNSGSTTQSSQQSGSGSKTQSSSQQSGSSSTSTTSKAPDPPPVVVIPDIAVPTSPGTKLAAAQNGAIDYSNADKGYVSAKYTGNKAKSKLQVRANGEVYNFDVTIGGGTEYFPLSMGNGHYIITLFELVQGNEYATVVRQEVDVNMTDPRSPYTYSNRYVEYDKNSQCVYKAAELCAGKTGTIDKISAIFLWVAENISYDYDLAATVKKGYTPDPDTTMKKRTGICFDYASLMAAMLRSQGIPTRLVIGDASPDIYHAWNEIYTEQTGWITPELMLKNNGYNLVDATFYSTAKDKKQIADYISNTANYYATYYY